MFGYVRPLKGELKINEYEEYKAVYCTLCKSIAKHYGRLQSFFLSYDLTFYVLLSLNEGFEEKNKCCVNCRIYDWGHFMMFTPMLFIQNFFSWSLFFTSLVVLIHWEIVYAKYPERFWSGSNKTLQCQNCKDKTFCKRNEERANNGSVEG